MACCGGATSAGPSAPPFICGALLVFAAWSLVWWVRDAGVPLLEQSPFVLRLTPAVLRPDPGRPREGVACCAASLGLILLTGIGSAGGRLLPKAAASTGGASCRLWRLARASAIARSRPFRWHRGRRTSNRNFEERQGPGGRTHLVSPATAATTAIAGQFVDARDLTTAVRRWRVRGIRRFVTTGISSAWTPFPVRPRPQAVRSFYLEADSIISPRNHPRHGRMRPRPAP